MKHLCLSAICYNAICLSLCEITRSRIPDNFKFKEYCPGVFQNVRSRFGIQDKDYQVCCDTRWSSLVEMVGVVVMVGKSDKPITCHQLYYMTHCHITYTLLTYTRTSTVDTSSIKTTHMTICMLNKEEFN